MLRYLVIEDEWEVATLLREVIEGIGSRALIANTGQQALQLAEQYKIDIALVDIILPDINGIELIGRLRPLCPDTVFIVVTSVFETDSVVRAIKEGASEYITKPFELAYLQRMLETYQELVCLRKKNTRVSGSALDDIIGESPQIKSLKKNISEVAPYDSTVLITGPTGSGKELVARAIHDLSRRNKGPFVVLDCTSISGTLMESELFGYKKGAFTGAIDNREGIIERADGGTLFIDEIGELDLKLQPKLLRFIETGVFRRVGSTTDRKVDVRIIAATNKDLQRMVKQGRFREDLYYRLNVITLHVPPLSERKDDVWRLANYFLNIFVKQTGKSIHGFSKEAETFIRSYNWPGNIRELKNLIERAVVMANGQWITPKDFTVAFHEPSLNFNSRILPLKEMQRRYIQHVLKLTGNNKSKAARLLGITRKTLREKLK